MRQTKKNTKAQGWVPLVQGDVVDIVAPASGCSQMELTSAIESLEQLGFVPRMPPGILSKEHPFLSNSDKKRFSFLKDALFNDTSKAIWCIRGGYGSIRILPELYKIKHKPKPKLVIGLSDITSLHNFLNLHWKWPTVHGPVLAFLPDRTKNDRAELFKVITGEVLEVQFTNLTPVNAAAKKNGRVAGPVMGGNLMTLQGSLGTPYLKLPDNSIVFLEEVNERGYRLDRLFTGLLQGGFFKKARAVVLGDFIGGDEPNGKNYVDTAIQNFANEVKIPVFRGLPCGHGKIQRPVPFGTLGILDLKGKSLTVETNIYK